VCVRPQVIRKNDEGFFGQSGMEMTEENSL
jgi:hypothetical protein